MLNDTFPLRVEAIPAAHASEWRADDSFPPSETQAWQLVFVRSGTIEERCDARHVLLRAGGLLFHQPGEVFAMTTVGEVPPETLRIDFYCTGAAMDRFRGAMLHTEPAEQHDLNWLANAANELFDAAPVPGGPPLHGAGPARERRLRIGVVGAGWRWLRRVSEHRGRRTAGGRRADAEPALSGRLRALPREHARAARAGRAAAGAGQA